MKPIVGGKSIIGSTGDAFRGMQFATDATRIAREAGRAILSRMTNGRQVLADMPRDVKIEADLFLDSFIRDRLALISDYLILSEESIDKQTTVSTSAYQWIVDPLDGSLNFSRGIPTCCISIGLWQGMAPIFGVIYDFHRDEMFFGAQASTATLNGVSIHTGNTRYKHDAIMCTGFPTATDFSEHSLRGFVKGLQTFKKVRLMGSAALSLAYVACGRADAYYEKDIAIWDVAGGLAIVQAAGGHIFIEPSDKKNRLTVRAAADRRLFLDDDA
jgi:myo-inositol-1(or 4)-monophosphatase